MRVGVFMIQKRKSSILVKKISLVRNQHLLHRMMMMTGYDLYNVTEMCECRMVIRMHELLIRIEPN